MSRYRDFLYLDEPSVDRMISSVEGGLYDDTEESWSSTSGTADGSSGDSPIAGVDSSATRTSASEMRRRMRQNAEARFSRLWKAIVDDADEDVFDWPATGTNVWKEAAEGKFCKIVGKLSVPPVIAMIASSTELLQLGRLLRQLGVPAGDGDTISQLETMTSMKDMIQERMPALLTVGEGQAVIALLLETPQSRVRPDRYIGHATVYGRVVERVESGSTFSLLNVPGAVHLPQPNRETRRKSGRSKTVTADPNELHGPAVVIRPIAITQ